MAGIGIAPLTRDAGLAALKRFVFGFLSVSAIAFIEALADFAADDAADNRTCNRRSDVATALAELIADKSACNAAEDEPCPLVIYAPLAVAAPGQHDDRQQRNRKARNAHGEPRFSVFFPRADPPAPILSVWLDRYRSLDKVEIHDKSGKQTMFAVDAASQQRFDQTFG
jgi:hypothetical protein